MGLPTQELPLIDEHGDENPPIESNRATVESHILIRTGLSFYGLLCLPTWSHRTRIFSVTLKPSINGRQATRSLSAFFTKTNAEHQEDGIVTEDRVGDLSASKVEDVGVVADVMSAKKLNGDL